MKAIWPVQVDLFGAETLREFEAKCLRLLMFDQSHPIVVNQQAGVGELRTAVFHIAVPGSFQKCSFGFAKQYDRQRHDGHHREHGGRAETEPLAQVRFNKSAAGNRRFHFQPKKETHSCGGKTNPGNDCSDCDDEFHGAFFRMTVTESLGITG
ncbi:MAG TPA: hypothetical protein VGN12_27540 [Pirellulales bacterium]